MSKRPNNGRDSSRIFMTAGNNIDMSDTDHPIEGVITIMSDQQHEERSRELGSALNRLSGARERRLSESSDLDMLDTPAARIPSTKSRRGLFSFHTNRR